MTGKKFTAQEFRAMLKKCALKATVQRVAVLEALYGCSSHPSAETIYASIHSRYPEISLGTVYKTLDSLLQANLAVKVPTKEGNSRYDWNTDYHNHIYCINTNEIIDFQDDGLKLILEQYFRNKKVENAKLKDFRLQINVEKIDPSKSIQIQ